MNAVRLLLISVLIIGNSLAGECGLPESAQGLLCDKTKRVRSLEELNSYLENYAAANGVAKSLLVDFDIDTESDLNIHSPCRVKFKKNRSFISTGNLCVNAKDGVYFHPYFTLKARDVELHSTKRVVIRNNANVDVEKLILKSLGNTPEARVHIRHHSTVKAKSLELFGEYRATLGHSSTYEVSSDIYMKSIHEFSSVWRDTIITTPEFEMESDRKIHVAKNVSLNSNVISLSAPECKTTNLVNGGNISGNCFSPDRPIAKLRSSSKEVNVLEEVTFNASKSSDNEGITSYEFFVNGESEQVGADSFFRKSFQLDGVYKVMVLVKDQSGLIDSAVRKVIVKKNFITDMEAFFHYEVEDGELRLIYHQNLPVEDIVSSKYVIDEDREVVNNEFYHLTQTKVLGLIEGDHRVSLEIIDKYDREFRFERIVTVGNEELMKRVLPVVDFDAYQVAPKKVFVDFRKSFEPYDGIEDIEIDWGDGNLDEIDAEDFSSFFHSYNREGTFEISFTVYKEVNNNEWIQKEVVKSIDVTSLDVSSMPPIVDFKADIEDFAPHVTFTSNFSISPTNEITSIIWDHGDGTSYIGLDREHIHFYNPGVYLPSLTVVDSNGVQSKKTMKVVVTQAGAPIISSIDCWNQQEGWVECEIVAVDKENQISELEINWGDGTSDTFSLEEGERYLWDDYRHNFQSEGSYNISFTVRTERSQEATSFKKVTVENEGSGGENMAPFADLSCNETGTLREVECHISNSRDDDGEIIKYTIFFGDGNSIEVNTPQSIYHTYSQNGAYELKLIVEDNDGATGEVNSYYEFINQVPVAEVSCFSPSLNELICESFSYDNDGYIVNTEFIWDEGSLSGQDTYLSTTLDSGGFKQVVVRVMDNEGAVSETFTFVDVLENEAPVAHFSCRSEGALSVVCLNESYDKEDIALSYEWSVDEKKYFSKDLDILLESGGVKSIKLTVRDSLGKESELILELVVQEFPAPIANFSCESVAVREVVCRSSSIIPAGEEGASFVWTLNEEIILTGNSLSYSFNDDDEKRINLSVIDRFGKESSFLQLVPIVKAREIFPEIRVLGFSSNTKNFLLGDDITLSSDLSKLGDGSIMKKEWFINNEMIQEGGDLILPSEKSGLFEVKLRITDTYNMVGESVETYSFSKGITMNYSMEILEEYAPMKLKLTLNNIEEYEGIKSIKWKIDRESLIKSGESIVLTLNYLGEQTIRLEVEDEVGFVYKETIPVIVSNLGAYIEGPEEIKLVEGLGKSIKLYLHDIPKEDKLIMSENVSHTIYDEEYNYIEILPSAFETLPEYLNFELLSDSSISKRIKVSKVNTIPILEFPENFSGEMTINDENSLLNGVTVSVPEGGANNLKIVSSGDEYYLAGTTSERITLSRENGSFITGGGGENYDTSQVFEEGLSSRKVSLCSLSSFRLSDIDEGYSQYGDTKLYYKVDEYGEDIEKGSGELFELIDYISKNKYGAEEIFLLKKGQNPGVVRFKAKNRMYINASYIVKKFKGYSASSRSTAIADYYGDIATHEVRHIYQHNDLKCVYDKMPHFSRKMFLEGEATRETFLTRMNNKRDLSRVLALRGTYSEKNFSEFNTIINEKISDKKDQLGYIIPHFKIPYSKIFEMYKYNLNFTKMDAYDVLRDSFRSVPTNERSNALAKLLNNAAFDSVMPWFSQNSVARYLGHRLDPDLKSIANLPKILNGEKVISLAPLASEVLVFTKEDMENYVIGGRIVKIEARAIGGISPEDGVNVNFGAVKIPTAEEIETKVFPSRGQVYPIKVLSGAETSLETQILSDGYYFYIIVSNGTSKDVKINISFRKVVVKKSISANTYQNYGIAVERNLDVGRQNFWTCPVLDPENCSMSSITPHEFTNVGVDLGGQVIYPYEEDKTLRGAGTLRFSVDTLVKTFDDFSPAVIFFKPSSYKISRIQNPDYPRRATYNISVDQPFDELKIFCFGQVIDSCGEGFSYVNQGTLHVDGIHFKFFSRFYGSRIYTYTENDRNYVIYNNSYE